MKPKVVALDLEATLISNVVSQIPRPHLMGFLLWCFEHMHQVVLFTAASTRTARNILMNFEKSGTIPRGAGEMVIIEWLEPERRGLLHQNAQKDLMHVVKRFAGRYELDTCRLLDDQECFVALGQRHLWVPVTPFCSPYSLDDTELLRLRDVLHGQLKGDGDD